MVKRVSRFLPGVLALAWLLSGCAEAPTPPPAAVPPPAPPVYRTPQELALDQALKDFHGAPYRSGGSTPQGVDCSGLVQAAFHRAGINLPRTVVQQFDQGQPVNREELRFGDVLFFNRFCQVRRGNYFMASILSPTYASQVCHNGIYLGQGRFLHASPKGVFVSRLDAEVWRQSFLGARRFLPAVPDRRD
ncbi:MAG: C40 family peptidase [Thermodesulfobacteriota bacterium]